MYAAASLRDLWPPPFYSNYKYMWIICLWVLGFVWGVFFPPLHKCLKNRGSGLSLFWLCVTVNWKSALNSDLLNFFTSCCFSLSKHWHDYINLNNHTHMSKALWASLWFCDQTGIHSHPGNWTVRISKEISRQNTWFKSRSCINLGNGFFSVFAQMNGSKLFCSLCISVCHLQNVCFV